jgi:hypothetical protein
VDWRTYVYDTLRNNAAFALLVPVDSLFGSGALEGAPAERPFVVLRFGIDRPMLKDGFDPVATSQFMTLYAHDAPGDFLRINQILVAARKALVGQVIGPGGICAEWLGDSDDLADDIYKTNMRNGEYQFTGKVV